MSAVIQSSLLAIKCQNRIVSLILFAYNSIYSYAVYSEPILSQ